MDMKRSDVAREAARILYSRNIKEYKEAKEIAAANLGVKLLPSNYEVAIELDRLAEKIEGSSRYERLIEMRKIALEIMYAIKKYSPKLIGSVWRGVAREGSDIDIIVSHDKPNEVLEELFNYNLIKVKESFFMLDGIPHKSLHLWFKIKSYDAEIVIHPREIVKERCEIFGDEKRGLKIEQLEKLIESDPLRRFIPRRRSK
jgi:predicted nucleotidyltransferase